MSVSLTSKRIGIVICTDVEKWGWAEAALELYKKLFTREGDEIADFFAIRGNVPTEHDVNKYDAFIFSGGANSTQEDLQWIKATKEFIAKASMLERKPKIVGICFGHQLIADALGGKVGLNPAKDFVLQSEEIKPSDKGDVLIKELFKNGPIKILESHSECILELPKGAKTLASSSSCEHEVVRFADNIIGVQGHPDLSPSDVDEKIVPFVAKRYNWDEKHTQRVKQSLYEPLNSEEMNQVLVKFLHS